MALSGQQPFKGWLSVGFRLTSEAVAMAWHVAFGCCGGRVGCVLSPLVGEAAEDWPLMGASSQGV